MKKLKEKPPLKEYRFKKDLTQHDVGLRAAISQTKICLVERGYAQFSEAEKARVAKAIGVRVDEIEW